MRPADFSKADIDDPRRGVAVGRVKGRKQRDLRQYARIVRSWVQEIGLDSSAYGLVRCAAPRRA